MHLSEHELHLGITLISFKKRAHIFFMELLVLLYGYFSVSELDSASVRLCLRPLRELSQPGAGLECQPGVEGHGVEPEEVAVEEVDDGVPGENTGGRLSSVLLAVVTVLQLRGGISHLIHLSESLGPRGRVEHFIGRRSGTRFRRY